MSSNEARLADRRGDIQKAIDLYESLIIRGCAEYIDYVNLIAIYFNCLGLGYVSACNIRAEIEEKCSLRAFELIDEVEKKIGENDELTFWRSYIPFFGWGEEIGEWDLRGDSLVPYVYLALEFPTDDNIKKACQLYQQLEKIEGSERKNLFMGRIEHFVK